MRAIFWHCDISPVVSKWSFIFKPYSWMHEIFKSRIIAMFWAMYWYYFFIVPMKEITQQLASTSIKKKEKLCQYFIHLLTSSHETDCQAHLHNNVNSLIIKIFILRFFLWFSSLLVFRKYITYNLSYIFKNEHISSKNCIFCKLYILTFITNRPCCDCVCKFVSDTFTFFMINILFKIIAYVPIDVRIYTLLFACVILICEITC